MRPCLPLLALAAALAAGPALAQPGDPPFPASRTREALAEWARRYTDIDPDRVVGTAGDALFAVEPAAAQPAAPVVRTLIRQEAVDPGFARRLGGRSAVMTADIDCLGRRVFQRRLDLYAGSNRQGAVRPMGAGADWQDVPAGTVMARVLAAVCDPARPPAPERRAAPPPPASSAPLPGPEIPPAPPRADFGRFATTDAAVQTLAAAAGRAPLSAQLRVEPDQGGYRALVDGFTDLPEAHRFCREAGCRLIP